MRPTETTDRSHPDGRPDLQVAGAGRPMGVNRLLRGYLVVLAAVAIGALGVVAGAVASSRCDARASPASAGSFTAPSPDWRRAPSCCWFSVTGPGWGCCSGSW
ncbi:hypothetical protein GCM10009841_14840 [Microlunatus panaciterrae]